MSPSQQMITNNPSPLRRTALECQRLAQDKPGWGTVNSDHMVTGIYTPDQGWHDFTLDPIGSFQLHPATSVLHYGQAIFEGLKAYRQQDGAIAAFRPDQNGRRFALSAERLAMPPLPDDLFLASLRSWRPTGRGSRTATGRAFTSAR